MIFGKNEPAYSLIKCRIRNNIKSRLQFFFKYIEIKRHNSQNRCFSGKCGVFVTHMYPEKLSMIALGVKDYISVYKLLWTVSYASCLKMCVSCIGLIVFVCFLPDSL